MNLQPTLIGKLVTLSPLLESNFEELFTVASDKQIWEQHPHGDRFKREVFRKFFDAGLESKGAFAVRDISAGKIIGTTRYYEYDPGSTGNSTDGRNQSSVAIGYTFLARSHWGHVYNPEMKKLMLDHAFKWVETVYFHVGETNLRSRKAMEKIGAEFDGPFRTKADPDNARVRYRIRRETYSAAPK